ncbi:MAG: hypothetical protein LBS43_11925 [Prevotellaceae bacterium]|jgi:hypothetical protein|nr:hypothetical protein [Prevotellaceae bacterium]
MREYHVPSEYSLFDFKQFIVADMDFDDSQQSIFFVLDENDKKTASYSVFDMDMVSLEDLCCKDVKKLLYTFDIFNDRSLYIEFQGITEAQPRIYYPTVIQSKGEAPNQFSEKIIDNITNVMFNEDDEDDEDYEYDDEEKLD